MIELIFSHWIDFLMNYTRFQDEQKAFEKFSKVVADLRSIGAFVFLLPNFLGNSVNCLEVFSKCMEVL